MVEVLVNFSEVYSPILNAPVHHVSNVFPKSYESFIKGVLTQEVTS